MNTVERKRPIKQFRCKVAFGPYRVGDTLQPTGLYRDTLIKRGIIEEVKDAPAPASRVAEAPTNRMVETGSGSLFSRGGQPGGGRKR